jgi:hypothetical protein
MQFSRLSVVTTAWTIEGNGEVSRHGFEEWVAELIDLLDQSSGGYPMTATHFLACLEQFPRKVFSCVS